MTGLNIRTYVCSGTASVQIVITWLHKYACLMCMHANMYTQTHTHTHLHSLNWLCGPVEDRGIARAIVNGHEQQKLNQSTITTTCKHSLPHVHSLASSTHVVTQGTM